METLTLLTQSPCIILLGFTERLWVTALDRGTVSEMKEGDWLLRVSRLWRDDHPHCLLQTPYFLAAGSFVSQRCLFYLGSIFKWHHIQILGIRGKKQKLQLPEILKRFKGTHMLQELCMNNRAISTHSTTSLLCFTFTQTTLVLSHCFPSVVFTWAFHQEIREVGLTFWFTCEPFCTKYTLEVF